MVLAVTPGRVRQLVGERRLFPQKRGGVLFYSVEAVEQLAAELSQFGTHRRGRLPNLAKRKRREVA